MTDLILYGLPPSSYVRTAMLVCEAKGVPYRLEPVNFRAPDYRARHPFARMPAMEHGDIRLYEVLAIATYVDETFDGPALQPQGTADRALMLQWISVANDYLYDRIVRSCVAERFIKPMRGLAPDEAAIAEAMPAITEAVEVLAAGLADRSYLCGTAPTLADYFAAPILTYFAATPEGAATLPARPAIPAWLARMQQSPGADRINTVQAA
jgi:glutathione S-transferase